MRFGIGRYRSSCLLPGPCFPIFLVLGLVLVLTLLARPSRSERTDSSTVEAARELFRRGVSEFEAEAYSEALRLFRESYSLVPHPETTFNIAGALSRLGRYREAIAEFEAFLAASSRLPAARTTAVQAEITRLRALLGALTIDAEPAGAVVSVDGTAVGTAPLDAPVEVDPGQHLVEVRLNGYDDGRSTVNVPAGGSARTEVRAMPRPAVLTIANLAPGATVSLDGVPVPTEQLETGVPVTAGRHVVLATAEGYETAEREVDAEPGARMRVEMPLARLLPLPILRVVGSEGAALSIDGEHVGNLPWEGSVEPGDRLLAIEGEGLHRWQGTAATRRGDVHEVHAELGRLPSGPDAAWVWAVAGIAAAAGAASLGFGIAALEANDDFDQQANKIQRGDYGSSLELEARQARGREAAADAEQWALWCDVSWGIAAAGAAAALVMLLLHDGGDEGPSVTFSSGGQTAFAAGWRW